VSLRLFMTKPLDPHSTSASIIDDEFGVKKISLFQFIYGGGRELNINSIAKEVVKRND